MNQPIDANDVLMGGGVKSAEFGSIFGTTIGGAIVGKPRAYQVREFDSNNPGGGALKVWPDGAPIMGINVDVRTTERDPEIVGDDGVRRLYLDKARQLAAVRLAVRAAGAEGLEQGGFLAVTLTGTEEGKGSMPANTWAATYRSPSTAVPGGNHASPGGRQGPGYAQGPPQGQQPQHAYAQPHQQPYAPANQGPPPAWATGPAPVDNPWAQSQTPPPPAPVDNPWASGPPQQQQPAPVQQYQAPPVIQQYQGPPPVANPSPVQQSITETMAAAMRNAGIDTSLFAITPG